MAQRTIVELVDDLDGTIGDDISTISFGLDGAQYEIDLTEANAERLREILDEFASAARRIGGRAKRASVKSAGTSDARNKEQTKAIRDWARQNDYDISGRGRIPSSVIEAFEQAHQPKPKKGK
ncbi:histone-like nucleoid-structuring protein Lsr2 [Actinokineospora iranica]|uniref:Lsr2 protein n=1 Tax=Actinokineospora iranica TaxID=1271860 RepID=A0A1G6S4U3_9PSEU|nr:Lsr2 family protein [Actinokineospora iranica]SDD11216.1 Lsr2 protein [Actinokineospora iranica]